MAEYKNEMISKKRKYMQYGKRLTACAAALTMALSACGIAAAESTEPVQAEADEAAEAAKKEETVYVIADAAGEPQKVIVSDRLDNEAAADTIEDETELSDVENIKGDETPTQTEDGEMEWDASGDDVFYQGTTDKELPVTVSVTYTLDGEEVSPKRSRERAAMLLSATIISTMKNGTWKLTEQNLNCTYRSRLLQASLSMKTV